MVKVILMIIVLLFYLFTFLPFYFFTFLPLKSHLHLGLQPVVIILGYLVATEAA